MYHWIPNKKEGKGTKAFNLNLSGEIILKQGKVEKFHREIK